MFDLGKIADQIGDRIKPVLQEGKKQAQINMLTQCIAQVYCAKLLRGETPSINECHSISLNFYAKAKEHIDEFGGM